MGMDPRGFRGSGSGSPSKCHRSATPLIRMIIVLYFAARRVMTKLVLLQMSFPLIILGTLCICIYAKNCTFLIVFMCDWVYNSHKSKAFPLQCVFHPPFSLTQKKFFFFFSTKNYTLFVSCYAKDRKYLILFNPLSYGLFGVDIHMASGPIEPPPPSPIRWRHLSNGRLFWWYHPVSSGTYDG